MPSNATTEDLLQPAPWIGQRWDRFDYELCDRDFARIGQLWPTADGSPQITASTDRTIMRELSGLSFDPKETADIDIFTDRLRPVMVLENGERFPLGIFLFGAYQREPWSPRCFDQGHILDQKVERSIALGAGGVVNSLFQTLAGEVGIERRSIEIPPVAVAEPQAWAAGTSRAQILQDLAELAGCLPPHFDNYGVLRLRPAPDPATVKPTQVYGPGRIVAQSVIESNDSYQAPNRYLVIGTSSTAEVVGTYDIPASAPHSIANRGFVVASVPDGAQGVADINQANVAARAAYLADDRSWQSVSFESLLDPRHDLFEVIRYEHDAATSGLYLETGFTMQLRYNGTHTHELGKRLWENR